MLRIITIILLSLFWGNTSKAQEVVVPAIIVDGDTIPNILLPDIYVYGKFKSDNYYRRYDKRRARLEYNVRKAYPYAKIAAQKVREIEARIAKVHNKSDRKNIIKEEYKGLMKTFKKPLSQLSITQGRILIRLIYRETNNTSFAHIREYRGTINAYFWQSVALLFGNNLKADYEPYGSDYEIEEIVRELERENR